MPGLRRTSAAVVVMVVVLAFACATPKPVPTPRSEAKAVPTWPEGWGIQFALRCTTAGNDARFCTCLANAVQKRWTPEQFKALEPDGLQDEDRVCRERLREGDR